MTVGYIVSALVIGVGLSGLWCVPCFPKRCCSEGGPRSKRLWGAYFAALLTILLLWSAVPLLWFVYSPISVCSPLLLRSAPPDREATTMSQWEGFWCTRLCGESLLAHPSTVEQIRDLVATATSLRVVGSGHSVTDLQCPEEGGVVMSIDSLCSFGPLDKEAQLARFSTGCTIRDVQVWLLRSGYQLIGYGAILSQTVGGALATSLHGEFTQASFGDTLVSLKAVLANGTVAEFDGDEVHAWVGSMGELGVMVQVSMRVWPTMRVLCQTRRGTQSDAEAALKDPIVTMLVINTLIGADAGDDAFSLRTCRTFNSSRTGESIDVEGLPDGTLGFVYETYGLSMLRLFSKNSLVRGPLTSNILLGSEEPLHEENAADSALHSAKGIYNVYPHSEIAVPMGVCMQFLDGVRGEAERLGVAYSLAIKVVPPSRAWRTWAAHKSCSINFDFYDFGHGDSVERDLRFRAFTEDLAVDLLGGGLHLGKMWVRPKRYELLQNAPRASEFEQLRKELDPTGKFQNEHTRAMHADGQCDTPPVPVTLDERSTVWRVSLWIGVAASVLTAIVSCATCFIVHPTENYVQVDVAKPLNAARPLLIVK